MLETEIFLESYFKNSKVGFCIAGPFYAEGRRVVLVALVGWVKWAELGIGF